MALQRMTQGGITYFQLFIACPVCIGQGKALPASFWRHHNCGGSIFVGENAYYLCEKCNTKDHVMNWEYGCRQHSTGPELEFQKVPKTVLAKAMSIAGQMVEETGMDWLTSFMQNM